MGVRRERRTGCLASLVLCCVAGAGCGAATDGVALGPPPPPSDFVPSPPLAPLVPPPSDAPGREVLVAVEAALQPRWAEFLEDVRLRLPPEHELNRPELSAVLELTLSPSGVLLNLSILAPSGSADFDEAALEVVRDAQPFAAVPVSWHSDDGKVRLHWRFSRDRRQAGAASAELVRKRWPLSKSVGLLLEHGRIDEVLERIRTDDGALAARVAELDRVSTQLIRAGLSRPQQRAIALGAVARGNVRMLAPEVEAMIDAGGSSEHRQAAASALGALGVGAERLTALVAAEEPALARSAAAALRRQGQGAALAVPMRARLMRGGGERTVALAVLAELAVPAAAKELAEIAKSGDRATRLAAIEALGRAAGAGSKVAGLRLLDMATDRDAAVRAGICRALSTAANATLRKRARWFPAHRLLRDRDAEVRAACVAAVVALVPSGLSGELKRLSADESVSVQAATASALAGMPGQEASAALLGLAASPAAEVRLAAAGALAHSKDERARASLAALVADPSESVRLAAVRVAGAAGIDIAAALEDESPRVREEALAALVAKLGRDGALARAVELFERAAGDERIALAGAWLGTRSL